MVTKQDKTKTLAGEIGLDRLAKEAQNLGVAAADRSVSSLVDRFETLADKLSDVGASGVGKVAKNVAKADSGAKTALKSGVEGVKETGSSTLKAGAGTVKGGAASAKDKLQEVFKRGSKRKGEGKKLKMTNIVEEVDVPAPRKVAYEMWTQFEEFPRFTKKVESVDQKSDKTVVWKAQILWSHRSWTAEIVDQVPNERIVWRSKGDKGHVNGAVTFHELAPDLTRILVVLEYHPQGLFEQTGNIWRAQGRRARLELKHFRRHVATQTLLRQDDVNGWSGEIHEGKVVSKDSRSKTDRSKKGGSSSSGRARKTAKKSTSSSPARPRKTSKRSAASSRSRS